MSWCLTCRLRLATLSRRLGLLSGVILIVAACSGASSATPVASPAASVTASSATPAANSPAASPSGTPLPDGTFKVSARDFSFSPLSLKVQAGEPFTIIFKNFDGSGVLHDVDIRMKANGTVVMDQSEIDGGQTSEYQYPELEAGEYVFICSIHPISLMTGKLTVN